MILGILVDFISQNGPTRKKISRTDFLKKPFKNNFNQSNFLTFHKVFEINHSHCKKKLKANRKASL
jgi:hypothetical protein